ncbi:MAG TPA: hypothetical protein VKE51_05785 [Vicinamibacterales bacterium]|nr:hypothetical protein [Vicinamibacterales bacterium]
MPASSRDQRDLALRHLDALIRRGRELQQSSGATIAVSGAGDLRGWQQQCAAAVTHLSGGSKAHWLSRAFSDALLVRSIDGAAVAEAPPEEIVGRLVHVLEQARTALVQMDSASGLDLSNPENSDAAPEPLRRFAFVHRRGLHAVLERTFADSRDAFDQGEFALALVLACGVLETIVTDALEHAASRAPLATDLDDQLARMPFADRIAAAERAGLISGACRRLPPAALQYRELVDERGGLRSDTVVLARDARAAGQVLRVVMRDLDPGR